MLTKVNHKIFFVINFFFLSLPPHWFG